MDKNSFMFAILNNPSLTQKDREKVIALITEDIEKDLMTRTKQYIRDELKQKDGEAGETEESVSQGAWIHNPREVCNFLKKFSSDPILRLAFHSWDRGEFKDYSVFIQRIVNCLNSDSTFKNLFHYNIGLNYTLREFLLNDGRKEFSIPKESIRIGLQYPAGAIQTWMANNPEKKLGEMPMTEFPAECRPKGLYNGRGIANMEELIEYFKHIIEFRDFDFEAMVFDTFENADFEPEIDDNVKGISFYTYTSVVKDFLNTVFDNVKGRILQGAPKTVKIFTTDTGDDTFELHVLHEGSFADKDIKDGKLLYRGNVASWRLWKETTQYNSLMSVCDYAVQSRFYSDDESHSLKSYRIDYLYPGLVGTSSDDIPEPRISLMENEAEGFEYIMRFYK
jgi:hypothetical protein